MAPSSIPNLIDALPPVALASIIQQTLHDRIVGTIFGSALGDAIGLYTEFLSKKAAEKEYPSRQFTLLPADQATPFCRDFHRSPHLLGEWTDDTDHALLLVLSFLHSNGAELDPLDLAARLRVWVTMGLRALDTMPLGLGRTVGNVVRTKAFLDEPQKVAYEVWVKGGRDVASNGSLMRTHPIGLMCLNKTLEETFETAARMSAVTHVDPRCVVSCMIGTALVRGLVRGEIRVEKDVDAIIDTAPAALEGITAKFKAEGLGSDEDLALDLAELRKHAVEPQKVEDLQLDAGGIGYVYKTLGAGVLLLRLAFRSLASTTGSLSTPLTVFEPLIIALIMEGGDADTNACFAGALLGALIGHRALPPHWRDGLRYGDWLLGKSEALSRVLGVAEGEYDGKADNDTHPDGGRGFIEVAEMERRWMLLQARVAQEGRDFTIAEEKAAKKKKRDQRWSMLTMGMSKASSG